MPSIIDIAKLANVSKSTVSRVISNTGYVKPETRVKILKVMEELSFRPNMFAKGMRTKRSFSVGIIFPDLSNPFFPEWYRIVDHISHEGGYLNYICISVHTPVVCCDSVARNEHLSYVTADGTKGTYQATNYLLETGRKRIGYIRGQKKYEVTADRFEGYIKALNEHGIPFDEDLVYEGNFKRECGFQGARRLMNLPCPPVAIMAATDHMALGALHFLKKNGYKVPQQVAVFGFDNLHISQDSDPPLSTIALPIREMAESTINTLITLMKEEHPAPVQQIFDCKLVVRESAK